MPPAPPPPPNALDYSEYSGDYSNHARHPAHLVDAGNITQFGVYRGFGLTAQEPFG